MIDLSHIPARHDAINARLEEWARYVRYNPQAWGRQPMFAGYQSKARHWDAQPHIHIAINTLDAHEIEQEVSRLPDKHRAAIRWHYVWPWVPVGKVRRELVVTLDALAGLINDSRDMVKNRLKAKTNA